MEKEIQSVLQAVPAYIRHIIVVDDASPDASADRGSDPSHALGIARIQLLLSAIEIDLRSVPREPLSNPLDGAKA